MSETTVTAKIPLPGTPFIGPDGKISREWLYLLISFLNRTGGESGGSLTAVQAEAETAQTTAETAIADARAAQTTANTAETTATAAEAAVVAETARAEAAEALLAPKLSPVFSGSPPVLAPLPAYANDAAAAVGGIGVGQLYWGSGVSALVQRRV